MKNLMAREGVEKKSLILLYEIKYYYTYGTVGYHVVLGGKENF